MNRKDDRRQVLSNFEALRSYLNNSRSSNGKGNLAQIIFAPHENIEILIGELVKVDGTKDFSSFVQLHKEIVNYLTQVDDYLHGQSQFHIADIALLKAHHEMHTGYESMTRELADLRARRTKLDLAKQYLEKTLPEIHHGIFDTRDCPQEVYDRGKRLFTDRSMRSSAEEKARNLPAKVYAPSGLTLDRILYESVDYRYNADLWTHPPFTIEKMEQGVRMYLQMALGAVLIDIELAATNLRIDVLKPLLDHRTSLPQKDVQELMRFQRNDHPVYNTGVYAGYAHTLIARLLVKIAQEISALGNNVSLNINLE